VISVALVRDCFAGRAMARVMSLTFIVFMAAPVLAPGFGQGVLLIASWRWIFYGIALLTAVVLVWFWLRMPETLHPHARNELNLRRILADCRFILRDRYAVGYTIAVSFLLGGLFGFINSVQQIVFDVLHAPHLITVVFIAIAGAMAVGSFTNSRLVMKLGMRRISHVALLGVILVSAAHLAVAWAGVESFATFILLQALLMLCFSLCMSNFSSMAMEDMGDVAGTASSLQGFVTTLSGALIGAAVGQAFDGTTVPLYLGFLLMGITALVVIAVTERGRLFHSR
jgi:DHA1 family bicyclomycin/chloramphenicol resistance-like MFS transporter